MTYLEKYQTEFDGLWEEVKELFTDLMELSRSGEVLNPDELLEEIDSIYPVNIESWTLDQRHYWWKLLDNGGYNFVGGGIVKEPVDEDEFMEVVDKGDLEYFLPDLDKPDDKDSITLALDYIYEVILTNNNEANSTR